MTASIKAGSTLLARAAMAICGATRARFCAQASFPATRDPELITLSQIVSAVDGPIQAGDFGNPHENGACDHEGQCVLLVVWGEVSVHMRRHLDSYTLAEMVERSRGGPPRKRPESRDHPDHDHRLLRGELHELGQDGD